MNTREGKNNGEIIIMMKATLLRVGPCFLCVHMDGVVCDDTQTRLNSKKQFIGDTCQLNEEEKTIIFASEVSILFQLTTMYVCQIHPESKTIAYTNIVRSKSIDFDCRDSKHNEKQKNVRTRRGRI